MSHWHNKTPTVSSSLARGRGKQISRIFCRRSSSHNLSDESRDMFSILFPLRSTIVDIAIDTHVDADHPITEQELSLALSNHKSTSPGDEGRTCQILCHLRRCGTNHLLNLHNVSWSYCKLPTSWKHAHIIPIPIIPILDCSQDHIPP